MKLACFLFLLLGTIFRLVKSFNSTTEAEDGELYAQVIGVLLGFFLQVVAIWYLSGYTLQ